MHRQLRLKEIGDADVFVTQREVNAYTAAKQLKHTTGRWGSGRKAWESG
jgi:hypothetical protein